MDRAPDAPAPPAAEVSLADAGIAAEIADAAARGRGPDRTPTLEQLLAAFGEREPTEAARRRVAAALLVAGMGVRPDLLTARPGERLALLPPSAGTAARRGRAALGLGAVAAVLFAAALAATFVGGSGGNTANDSLPATTTIASIPAPAGATATTSTAPAPRGAATAGTTATTDTTTATTGVETTTTAAAAAGLRARRASRHKAAAAHRRLSVVVDASAAPTFLCVDDGAGHQLFGGTLSGRQTFHGRRIRLNVGLASTVVTVDGNRVPLSGSPAGLDITRRGGAQSLPLGQRPCG